jgi:hypothetical protein
LEPEDIKEYMLGGHLELQYGHRAPGNLTWGTKGLFIKAQVHQDRKVSNPSAVFLSMVFLKMYTWCSKTCRTHEELN